MIRSKEKECNGKKFECERNDVEEKGEKCKRKIKRSRGKKKRSSWERWEKEERQKKI